jgi:hypothetical protein
MELPTKIKVGDKWYSVDIAETMQKKRWMGSTNYGDQRIRIGKRSNVTGKAFNPTQIKGTFWHELTHAILYDMGSPLYTNEQFVHEFSKRLNKSIISARF